MPLDPGGDFPYMVLMQDASDRNPPSADAEIADQAIKGSGVGGSLPEAHLPSGGSSAAYVRWGIGASILLHVLVVTALLVDLPQPTQSPPAEETVSVEIVPPPEPEPEQVPEPERVPEAQPEPPPEPLKIPEFDKPEEAEKPPEPEQPPQPETPPEPPKQEEAAPPPPAPPPPPPPPPPPETAEQEQAKPQSEAGAPIPTLQPVFKFGDKNQGPEQAANGDSAQTGAPDAEEAKPDETQPDEPKPEEAKPDDVKPDAVKPEETPAEQPPAEDAKPAEQDVADAAPPPPGDVTQPPDAPKDAPADAAPDAVAGGGQEATTPAPAAPEVLAALPRADAADPQAVPPPAEEGAGEGAGDGAAGPPASVTPTPRPAAPPAAAAPALKEAKRLYSASATGDMTAMTAMGNIPRGARAGQLCGTELQAQLRNNAPRYMPELIPAYTLGAGSTSLDVRRGAFRAGGVWYDVSFRCTVDKDATSVTSFSFAVGGAVPRSEWRKRRFPEL
ncbi:DUF930 domain-containing protein [Rhizobium sp. 0TCS1.26]|uniref:DUF930 domain-containing protein n=1 Tax=Rhizobium sp. 0TCS1.26 TaxID=3142623 RepID=UPI003D27FF7C